METKKCSKCKIEKNINLFNSSKTRKIPSLCKECLYILQKRRWRERKIRAIRLMGRACCKCQYNKCINALEFHHLDPSLKTNEWKKMRTFSWDKLIEELKKCILVCSNCHKEIHAYKEDLSVINKDNINLNQNIKSTGTCLLCQSEVYGTLFCSKLCKNSYKINKRKVERPSKEELQEMINTMSYCAIGRKYNVSDNAVRKWAKYYGLI